MFTIKLWNFFIHLELIDEEYLFQKYYEVTPEQKALALIMFIALTPLIICLDIILLPIELIYYALKDKYIKQLEDENVQDKR